MKKIVIVSILSFLGTIFIHFKIDAQNVLIQPSGITPAPTGNIPRLTYDQIAALSSPQLGDLAFDITYKCLRYYDGSRWNCTNQDPSNRTATMTAWQAGGLNTDINGVNEEGVSISSDNSGNIYIAGKCYSTSTFGNIISTGNAWGFIAKYNQDGQTQWVIRPTTTNGGYVFFSATETDNNNNLYVTGTFSGIVNFGNSTLTSTQDDIFIAKYNSSGTLLWAVKSSVNNGHRGVANDIEVDINGNLYITGSFRGSITFGMTTLTTDIIYENIFIAKCNSNGVFVLATAAGVANKSEVAYGLAVDNSGNIYITGYFYQSTNFGNINIVGTTTVYNGFVAVYSSNFNVWGWAKVIYSFNFVSGTNIAIDTNNNIYVSGSYDRNCTFTKINSDYIRLNGEGYEMFLAKFDIGGNFQWVKKFEGSGDDYTTALTLDNAGNIFFGGYFSKTIAMGSTTFISAGLRDFVVVKVNSNGIPQWAIRGGGEGNDFVRGITLSPNGSVYVTGSFGSPPAEEDEIGKTSFFGAIALTPVGVTDIFVAKIQGN
jgi:Beta-propeller repeat